MDTDGKAPGCRPEPKGQKRREGIIRLVKSCVVERGAEAAPRPARHEREALTRAEVAVIALRDAMRAKDRDERRQWLLLAQASMLKSLHRLEVDLQRIPA